MKRSTNDPEGIPILAIASALFAGSLALLFGGVLMALAMGPLGGHMGMMGGRSTASQTPSVASGTEATVEIRDFAFSPADLTVRAGTKVTWVNRDAAPHDATADDKGWRTELLGKGKSATVTFDTPGAYTYHCSVHPYMKAVVTVQP